MPISYTELPDSTYLDFTSYRSGAAPLSGGTPVAHFTMNVALVLDRANDPTALLDSNWGSREQQLAALNQSGTLWSTCGADPTKYSAVLAALHADGIQTVDELGANGYVSSVESRTIWVHLDETNFTTLFGPGATLLAGPIEMVLGRAHLEGRKDAELAARSRDRLVEGDMFRDFAAGAVEAAITGGERGGQPVDAEAAESRSHGNRRQRGGNLDLPGEDFAELGDFEALVLRPPPDRMPAILRAPAIVT